MAGDGRIRVNDRFPSTDALREAVAVHTARLVSVPVFGAKPLRSAHSLVSGAPVSAFSRP